MMPRCRPYLSQPTRCRALAAILLLWLACLPSAWALDVTLQAGYIPAAPPGAKVLAGYMTLHNRSTQPISLTVASSEAFQRVELHRSMRQGGTVRMVQLGRIEIPAQGALEFKPGGYHLMLIGPRHPLNPGTAVPIILRFDNGATLSGRLMVQAAHIPGQRPTHPLPPGQQH